ncbi:MAG: peptidase M4 family protein [Tatlockia sp.]|nr:peptidase M4 family protein [Tatlockia sp.]
MRNNILAFLLLALSSNIFASDTIHLYQAPLSNLSNFKFVNKLHGSPLLQTDTQIINDALYALNETKDGPNTVTRYQQLFKGIPIVGAQVMVVKSNSKSLNIKNSQVNGQIVKDIQLDIKPAISSQEALGLAKKSYFDKYAYSGSKAELSQLQIRPYENGELRITYLVSFLSRDIKGKPVWPIFIIDAQSGTILQQWNNIKNYLDSGPGGNEKVHEYWYGKDGLPSLDVVQKGSNCVMESKIVRLVNLKSKWDWDNTILAPSQYDCDKNVEETINGAFSPSNDAYYFGHIIVEMYKNWYGLNALQHDDGSPMQLIMRVHFGRLFDNAFWNGQSMSFGDGDELFPLISLDITGHEVTHGFTEHHSNLEYHDESGAINESLSDMAGQAARAYLLETNPALYNKSHITPNKITWGVGETVMRDQFGTALRYMDQPSTDGDSADCLDKSLARRNGAKCGISYKELLTNASRIDNPDDRQNYIVHTASGIFNKAFYLLSQKIGIKEAYHAMALANIKYWRPNTGFKSGACGALFAGKDLGLDPNLFKTAFAQVGVDTQSCFN